MCSHFPWRSSNSTRPYQPTPYAIQEPTTFAAVPVATTAKSEKSPRATPKPANRKVASDGIGMQVGENWESWKDSLHYVDYAVLAMILLGLGLLLVRHLRRRSGAAAGG